MHRTPMLTLTLALSALLTTTAAQAGQVNAARPASERLTDGGGVFVCEALGAFVGLLAGVALSYTLDRGEPGTMVPDSMLAASLGGAMLGSAGGLVFFDAVSDGDGDLKSGLVGQGIGVALIGLGWHRESGDLVLAGLGTVLIGGALGYALEDRVETRPLIGAMPDGQGGTRYAFGLAGAF